MEIVDASTAESLGACHAALTDLLIDIVEGGNSVGFRAAAVTGGGRGLLERAGATLATGSRLLWIARDASSVLGTVQMELATKKNGVNRAEIQKLLVHRRARRRGVARTLMQTAEATRRELGRGLLFLDTEAGSDAEAFYRALDYTCIGGLPEYACSPHGEWRANAIYYKTLFSRGMT